MPKGRREVLACKNRDLKYVDPLRKRGRLLCVAVEHKLKQKPAEGPKFQVSY